MIRGFGGKSGTGADRRAELHLDLMRRTKKTGAVVSRGRQWKHEGKVVSELGRGNTRERQCLSHGTAVEPRGTGG